jgi:hypothetical protein
MAGLFVGTTSLQDTIDIAVKEFLERCNPFLVTKKQCAAPKTISVVEHTCRRLILLEVAAVSNFPEKVARFSARQLTWLPPPPPPPIMANYVTHPH